ncbi:MAG: VOC family protein [Burkholderiales bacterium]|jgi:PhnB protein|nr:VOC family protein [Burkholderiales bacterium]
MIVEPYLFFEGRCEEAMTFYTKAVGAKVEALMRFKESPEPPPPGMVPPGSENKVMHALFRIGDSAIMASDGGCSNAQKFDGFSLTITVANEAEAKAKFTALSEGGAVTMPLGKTFFSPCFGMLTDKFGVGWMLIVQ